MRYILLPIALALCFSFTSLDVALAQDQFATSSKKTFFQNLLVAPKNFFKKIFTAPVKLPSPPQTETGVSAETSPKNEARTTGTKLKAEPQKTLDTKKQKSTTTQPSILTQENERVLTSSIPVASSLSAELKLIVATGGNVFSQENKISCYSNETCNKTVTTGKEIKLQAIALEGYSFKGWSEARCGKEMYCTITLSKNMTVKARFEVTKQNDQTGTILSPKEGETCHIPLGEDRCNVMLMWKSTAGLDMTVEADYDKYYVAIEDENMFPKLSGTDPISIAKAKKENADGLVYFTFFTGDHKLTILHRGKVMDSVNFSVACTSGLFWDGQRCWEKNAKILHVFKDQHAIITSSDSRILCGYRPERCTTGFSNGTKVTLKVTVDDGYVFDGWTGECSGKETTCTLTMDSNKSVGVKFK